MRDQLCVDLGKPKHTVLHWSQNIKSHTERKYVARTLGSSGIYLSYVILDKSTCANTPDGLGDHTKMYNYALRRLLERISWFAKREGRGALITIAHVKNFKYSELTNYLELLRRLQTSISWAYLAPIKIRDTKQRELLQLADIAAGALSAAIVQDAFGDVEFGYLSELQNRIYRHTPGKVTTYGLHVISNDSLLAGLPWWPSFPK